MGKPNKISLSKSALVLSPCIHWAGQGVPWFDESRIDKEDTQKRDTGTETHSLIHKWIASDINAAAISSDCDAIVMSNYAVDYIESVIRPNCELLFTEVVVGINWSTGDTEIAHVTDRNYPDRQGYYYGTADLVALMKDTTLVVLDWKTGETDGAEEQLLSLACGFQNCMTMDGVPRPVKIICAGLSTEGCFPKERFVSNDELSNHWDAMAFRTEDIEESKTGEPVPGVHCTKLYCPHLGYCKAIGSAVVESGKVGNTAPPIIPVQNLIHTATKNGTLSDKPLTDQEAGVTMALISAARRQMKYVETGVKNYIKQGGKVLLNGYEWSDGPNGHRWRKQ